MCKPQHLKKPATNKKQYCTKNKRKHAFFSKVRNLLVNWEEEPKHDPRQGGENPRHKNNSVQHNKRNSFREQ